MSLYLIVAACVAIYLAIGLGIAWFCGLGNRKLERELIKARLQEKEFKRAGAREHDVLEQPALSPGQEGVFPAKVLRFPGGQLINPSEPTNGEGDKPPTALSGEELS